MAAGRPRRFRQEGAGNIEGMITFFVILVVLMVLVAFAGQWSRGPSRRVVHRDVVVDRGPEVVEEIIDEPYPVARSRRVVRRRRL